MQIDARLIGLPSVEGVRVVASSLLAEAEQALVRLERAADGEALHDFRVAVRRLRSNLQAFRPYAQGRLRKKHLRELAELAKATTSSRDAEVQLAWLARESRRISSGGRPAVDRLVARLEALRRTGYEEASGRLAARFRRVASKLARRLEGHLASGRRARRGTSFGALLAELARSRAAALDEALDEVTGPFDVEPAHRARIAAKRLRYLLEPVRGIPGAGTERAVEILKELQDILGELHDAHVASELLKESLTDATGGRARPVPVPRRRAASRVTCEDPGPGLLLLDRRARERAARAHEQLVRRWLPRQRAPLALAVARVLRRLEAAAPGGRGQRWEPPRPRSPL